MSASSPTTSITTRINVTSGTLDAPIHSISLHRDETARGRGIVEERMIWMNPITNDRAKEAEHIRIVPSAETTPTNGAHTTSATSSASSQQPPPRNRFGDPPPALLTQHLSIVTTMQSQLQTFKHQLRGFIECFVKYQNAISEPQPVPPTGAGAATSSPASIFNRELMQMTQALYMSHSLILAPIMSSNQPININGTTMLKKDLFDMLDLRFNSLSFDLPPPPRGTSRLNDPRHIINGEVYSGDQEVNSAASASMARYRNVSSTLGVSRPYFGEKIEAQLQQSHTNGLRHGNGNGNHSDDEKDLKHQSMSIDFNSHLTSSASTPSIPSLLSSTAHTYNYHSATLLNLVQCSGLNPFEDVQRKIRDEYVLPTADIPATPANAVIDQNAYISALDATLLHFLTTLHERWHPLTRFIEQRHNEETRRAREGFLRQNGSIPPAQLDAAVRQAVPKPATPNLPYVRKIHSIASTASPYAPTPFPAATRHLHSTNPIDGIIFTLPQVMHVFIAFEGNDAHAFMPPSTTSTASSDIISSSFAISRLAAVHPSELGSLVDAFAISSYHLYRDISAQLTSALWTIRARVREEMREEQKSHTSADGKSTLPHEKEQFRVLSLVLLHLSSYWDLFLRPCAACKLHLAPHTAHPITFSRQSLDSPDSAPIPSEPTILMQPSMRLLPQMQANEMTSAAALHTGCVELWRQQQAK